MPTRRRIQLAHGMVRNRQTSNEAKRTETHA